MPWGSVTLAKKAGAITKYRKKPISIAAINKLYEIYDSVKGEKKVDSPMAVAISSWKGLVTLKNGTWVLKPVKKAAKKETADRAQLAREEVALPMGAKKLVSGGSFEDFKETLKNALEAQFGGKETYMYIVGTYTTKVCVHIERAGKSEYYEIPYTVKGGLFSFGTPVKVVKVTKFQKADQKNWADYRANVQAFVSGKGKLGDAVASSVRIRRELLCPAKS